ncbi:MAG: penicillin-binding protein 1B [Pseudomonadales bacterium]|nr:penicillin-binding protein 1B [Pseudomonadales bacterium]
MVSRKKASTKAVKSKKTIKQTKKARVWRWLLSFTLKLSIILMLFSAMGLFYLDAQIRQKFEGKRWSIPAKVYARPLDLYSGLEISITDLKGELKGLGYRFVKKAKQPGEAEIASTRVKIYSRGFEFSDGIEVSQLFTISFNQGAISVISAENGSPISITRLEPILIGGIYPKNNEDRDLIRLSQAPRGLVDALIAIEDRSYYQHFGISPKGIARAMWDNLRAGRFVQGGSTLPQQLIKNFYLTSERTLIRKLIEMPMAIVLDFRYSKDEILEAYLNEVYLGQEGARGIHGFGLAAQYFFARPISELQLHQVALLAAMVKGPSYYDPRRRAERAKERRNLVLRVMAENGDISDREYRQSILKPLGVVRQKSLHKGAYPAYLDLVRRKLKQSYNDEDLSSEGLRIFTSLDPIAQAKAEKSLAESISALQKKYGKKASDLEASMVVTDPQTGEVLAIIGGKSTRYQGFNRAIDAVRPIGSLIKPAVYLTGLQRGYNLATMLQDEAVSVPIAGSKPWQPKNFDKKTHGNVPFYLALAKSYNLSTARLGMELGLDNVIKTIHTLGITREIKEYPSLLLGAQGMTPLEVATMYQTIAANGFLMPMRAIRSVTDKQGRELSRYPFKVEQVVNSQSIYQLQFAMQQVVSVGTGRYANAKISPKMGLAGKTGTSNDQRDSWFAGFSGNKLAVVWLGRDDNKSLPFTGSSGALRVWTAYMQSESLQPLQAAVPEGIEFANIDIATGYSVDPGCDNSQRMPFRSGESPAYSYDCGTSDSAQPKVNQSKPAPSWLERIFGN